jgi:ABC-type dipeptide/oligopeptide/nickel transport systems, permease components
LNIWGYVIRRLLYIVPMVIGITAITFFTVFAAAGNPVAIVEANDPELPQATLNALINYLQLNRPPAIQYLNWLWNVVHLNFGVSIQSGRPVSDIIWSWAWTTIYLQLAALAVSVALAIPISVYAAKRRNSLGDFVITGVSVFGISAPVFWVGEMLIILFAV